MAKNRDVMTKDPCSVSPAIRSRRSRGIMKQEDVGSVPVVESVGSRRLIGIVTDRDIVVKASQGARQPTGRPSAGRDDPNPSELPRGR